MWTRLGERLLWPVERLHRWLYFLNLETAVIALAWQAAIAVPNDMTLTWIDQLVLGLTAWIISLADTLLSLRRGIRTSARHRLYARHQGLIIMGLGFLAGTTLALALTHLPAHVLSFGGQLGAGVVLFLVTVRWGPRWLLFLKPLVYGPFLLLGCAAAFIPAPGPDVRFVPNPYWFSLLVFLSLPFVLYAAIIAAMERKADLREASKIRQSIREYSGVIYGLISFFLTSAFLDLVPVLLWFSLLWQIACWNSLHKMAADMPIRINSLLATIGMIGPAFAYAMLKILAS